MEYAGWRTLWANTRERVRAYDVYSAYESTRAPASVRAKGFRARDDRAAGGGEADEGMRREREERGTPGVHYLLKKARLPTTLYNCFR